MRCFTYETFSSIGQTKGEILRWTFLQKSQDGILDFPCYLL